MRITLLFFILLSFFQIKAQDVTGTWKTIDDESGQAKSYVKLYLTKSDKIAGKIVKILNEDRQDALCTKCSDYRKDKPILGMIIVTGLEKDGDEWSGGKILDPNKGKIYKCKIWLEDNDKLKVRGYIGPFFRTQTWYRVEE